MCKLVPAGDNDDGEQTRAMKRHREHVSGVVGGSLFCKVPRLCALAPALRGGRTVLCPTRDIFPGYRRPLLRQGFCPTASVPQVNFPLKTPGSTLREGHLGLGGNAARQCMQLGGQTKKLVQCQLQIYEEEGSEDSHGRQNLGTEESKGESESYDYCIQGQASQSPAASTRILRDRPPSMPPLPPWGPTKKTNGKIKTRGNWTNDFLTKALDCYDLGFKFSDCAKTFNIPKSSLRDHLSGKTTTKRIGPKTVLSKQEEGFVIEYIYEMLDVGQPLTPQMLKLKVAEICQKGHIH